MTAQRSRPRFAAISICLSLCCLLGLCFTIAVWLIPVDVVKVRAYDAALPDPFAQFEAIGRAEALLWFLRVGAIPGTLIFGYAWYRRIETTRFVAGLSDDILAVLNVRRRAREEQTQPQVTSGRPSQAVLRLLRCIVILSMLTLACVHQVYGINQRAIDWAYYRFKDGDEILPNISDSNRAVIRYLRAATPENSRIFVVSDQKLFFLSYYLLPRRILHHMHPAAEHIIPRKNQERQLAAYRLAEIPASLLAEQKPDFVLEYFEGPEFVQPERATEDSAFLTVVRNLQHDANYVPPYTVVLRPWTEAIP